MRDFANEICSRCHSKGGHYQSCELLPEALKQRERARAQRNDIEILSGKIAEKLYQALTLPRVINL